MRGRPPTDDELVVAWWRAEEAANRARTEHEAKSLRASADAIIRRLAGRPLEEATRAQAIAEREQLTERNQAPEVS